MTTLTPSQYEALPEAEKVYWKRRELKLPLSVYVEYTPVMIPLAEAATLLIKTNEDVRRTIDEQADTITHGMDYTQGRNTGLRLASRILTEALTKLKNLKS